MSVAEEQRPAPELPRIDLDLFQSSSWGLVHLLHVAVGWRGTLPGVGEEVRGNLWGQRGWSFRVQVCPEHRLAGGLENTFTVNQAGLEIFRTLHHDLIPLRT